MPHWLPPLFRRLSTETGRYAIWLTLLLAYAVLLYRLDARTFHGDELGSVFEAQRLGLNANSIPYFAILRLWIQLGAAEFWVRSISALSTLVMIAVTYVWIRQLCGLRVARLASLLLATGPFLIIYSQQTRFYAIGLLGAALSLWAFVRVLKHPDVRTLSVAIFASILAVATLLLNALLIVGQGVTLFLASRRLTTRTKIFFSLAALALGAALVAIPVVRQIVFDSLAAYTNAQARYVDSRGWSLAQVAKIPLTLFFFTFGESVYPLALAFVIPGSLVFGFALIRGVIGLWRSPRVFWLVVGTSVSAVTLMYLVFDPLAPPQLQGAAPRYLIFLLPLFYLAVAMGARARFQWLAILLLFVNLGSLGFYWFGDWAYTDDLVNWRGVIRWVEPQVTPRTGFVFDGQAEQPAEFYFPADWSRHALPLISDAVDISAANNYSRLIIFSYNWHPEARVANTAAILALTQNRVLVNTLGQYPLFVFVYDHSDSVQVDARSGAVPLPSEIYGLEFQDIHLPLAVNLNGKSIPVLGAFGLPALDGNRSRAFTLDSPAPARRVWLLSNFIGANLPEGTVIAQMNIVSDSARESVPIRVGSDTAAWSQICAAPCSRAYMWRKRFALLGNERYPEAWQEFDAAIFAAPITLGHSAPIRSLELLRVDSRGTFYVWGIVLEP